MNKEGGSYIFKEVIRMGVDSFDDGIEVLDALDATVNQLWEFHFILNYY